MYVGKTTIRMTNSFKFATGNDWWFHAKEYLVPHVIVKSNNEELLIVYSQWLLKKK